MNDLAVESAERKSGPGTCRVALAQVAPVFLDREQTLVKVCAWIREAAEAGCDLVAFGEALVPGYPVWVGRTDGARFDAADQKELYARYVTEAVRPEAGDLDAVCGAARDGNIAVVLGVIERAVDRGGHSLYCSRVFIDGSGAIASIHRKLMPTYEERLVWAIGDGAGLQVHPVGPFTVGALNCYENWMPLVRAALIGMGEDLHVAIWPGCRRNTDGLTPFIAREARSFVLSVSGLLRAEDIPADVPHRDRIVRAPGEVILDGGTAAAGPDGSWLLEPLGAREELAVLEIDHARVLEERQIFDPAGHYSRPDVMQLLVNRERQGTVIVEPDPPGHEV